MTNNALAVCAAVPPFRAYLAIAGLRALRPGHKLG